MENVQKVVSDFHGKRKCKQCGAVKPLVDFRPYHNSTSRCHTCLVCESINGKRRYLEKKQNNGTITETEQEELDKIYKLYSILEAKGLKPPRISPGKRGAESTVIDALDYMLAAFESDEDEKVGEITTGATLEAYMDIVEKAEMTEDAKEAVETNDDDTDAYDVAEVEEITPVRSVAVPKVPTKPASKPSKPAFIDRTAPAQTPTQRPEAAPVVPTQNEVYQVARDAVSGKAAPPSIEQARAEIVQWLTAELTDEPEYYLDVVYERLRDKWMPVISGTKGFFDEVRANSALKEDFSKLLRRFEDYEDAYWEDK